MALGRFLGKRPRTFARSLALVPQLAENFGRGTVFDAAPGQSRHSAKAWARHRSGVAKSGSRRIQLLDVGWMGRDR